MTDATRWAIVFLVTLCVVGLIAYARGPKHHHGDALGTHGTKIIIVQPSQ